LALQETPLRALSFAFAFYCFAAWCQPAYSQSVSAPELSLAKSVVSRYCSAWSKVDPAERKLTVEEVWAERGEYLDSQPIHVVGRKGLAAEIGKFQQQFPGAHFRCDTVRAHHGFLGYTWAMVMADGTERFKGMDFGEIDSAGRLVRIVSFFNMPQPAK
jgi:hypothetical protein